MRIFKKSSEKKLYVRIRKTMKNLHIVLFQASPVWKDEAANRALFGQMFGNVKGRHDLFLLPEMFGSGFVPDPASLGAAHHERMLSWMKDMSVKHQAALAGSVVAEEHERWVNRFYMTVPEGEVKHYDKRHLFGPGREPENYKAGEASALFSFRGWNIRPLICYDLRFPVWARNRFNGQHYEYDLMVVSANWPAARHDIWRTLLMARAIENQCYVAGINRTGTDGNGWTYRGGSGIAAPWGEWVCGGNNDESEIIEVELNASKLTEYRRQYPFAADWDPFRLI